ncbi:uncharacterized protein LOC128871694 [Anastrepha ludens]|uniref:uncharacterized protein LOC128871694 n=1 Tax=Anastrepha ludens TaxID=28586 RepID=UPI0023B0C34F|nr:uncharacterized protein LOC128871694 [Anastrepha ludens]
MAFSTQKEFFHVPFMNESVEYECRKACVKLKTYQSTIDDRSWAMDESLQSRFLSDLVTCQSPVGGIGYGDGGEYDDDNAGDEPERTGGRARGLGRGGGDRGAVDRGGKGRSGDSSRDGGKRAGDEGGHVGGYGKGDDMDAGTSSRGGGAPGKGGRGGGGPGGGPGGGGGGGGSAGGAGSASGSGSGKRGQGEMVAADSVLACATEHMGRLEELLLHKKNLEKQLDVSNERLKVANMENEKIKAIMNDKFDSNHSKDFYNKIQKLTSSSKISKGEENELLQIYNKFENMSRAYEVLQAENAYLKRLMEKLSLRASYETVKIEPEKSSDIAFLQNEVNKLRQEVLLLRKFEDEKLKERVDSNRNKMSDQDIGTLKAIIKERNALRDKCKTFKDLEAKVNELQKIAKEADKMSDSLSNDLDSQSKHIVKMEYEMKQMQEYYENQIDKLKFDEEVLKCHLEDMKKELQHARCKAQKAECLQMEIGCLRNELMQRDWALNDYDCQYKQLMNVIDELQGNAIQNLHDTQTQTCVDYMNDLTFFARATLSEIKKELKKRGGDGDKIGGGIFGGPAITDGLSPEDCCAELRRLQDIVKQLTKQNEMLQSDVNNAQDHIMNLKKGKDDLNIHAMNKLNEFSDRVDKLDSDVGKTAKDTAGIDRDLQESIKLVRDISDIQLKNAQLTNAVNAITTRDDEKLIADLRRQLLEEQAKNKKCLEENKNLQDALLKRGIDPESAIKEIIKVSDVTETKKADAQKGSPTAVQEAQRSGPGTTQEDASKVGGPAAGKKDEPAAGKISEPEAGKKDGPSAAKIGEPEAGKKGEPDAGKKDGPGAAKFGEPEAAKKGEPSVGKKDEPGAGKISEPEAAKKGGPDARKEDGPGATKDGGPGVGKKDAPGTGKESSPYADQKGGPDAGKKDGPDAGKKDGPGAAKTGESDPGKKVIPDASKKDAPDARQIGESEDNKKGGPDAGKKDSPGPGKSSEPDAAKKGGPDADKKDGPGAGKVDVPEAGKKGGPAAGKKDGSGAGKAGEPDAAKKGGPDAGKKDGPGAGKVDVPEAGKKGGPDAGKKDGPGAGKVDVPEAGKKGGPAAGKKDDPGAGKVDVPETGKKGEPDADKKGGPGAVKKDDPGIGRSADPTAVKRDGPTAAKDRSPDEGQRGGPVADSIGDEGKVAGTDAGKKGGPGAGKVGAPEAGTKRETDADKKVDGDKVRSLDATKKDKPGTGQSSGSGAVDKGGPGADKIKGSDVDDKGDAGQRTGPAATAQDSGPGAGGSTRAAPGTKRSGGDGKAGGPSGDDSAVAARVRDAIREGAPGREPRSGPSSSGGKGRKPKISDAPADDAFQQFIDSNANTMITNINAGSALEKELRAILNAFMMECGFCFCKSLVPKSKFYALCHKLLHNGIQCMSFRELAYMHRKVFMAADKLHPGCLIDLILTEQGFKDGEGFKCCHCKNALCCSSSEEMLKQMVCKLERDVEMAQEKLDSLRMQPRSPKSPYTTRGKTYRQMEDSYSEAVEELLTCRETKPVLSKMQSKQMKTLKARIMKCSELLR